MRSFMILVAPLLMLLPRGLLATAAALAFQAPSILKPLAFRQHHDHRHHRSMQLWQLQRPPTTTTTTALLGLPNPHQQDNIMATVAAVTLTTLACSLIVLWSEVSVIQSGCGPLLLNDTIERTAYLVVLLVASCCWFCRVAFNGESLSSVLKIDPRQLVLISEAVSYLTVLGAVVALLVQMSQGVEMDGFSGIDIEYCRSRQGFQSLLL